MPASLPHNHFRLRAHDYYVRLEQLQEMIEKAAPRDEIYEHARLLKEDMRSDSLWESADRRARMLSPEERDALGAIHQANCHFKLTKPRTKWFSMASETAVDLSDYRH